MNFSVTDKIRSYILAAVLGLTIIALLITLIIAQGQDRVFRSNYALYQNAVNLMGSQKYAQALKTFQGLDAASQANYYVLYMEGLCAAQSGDYAAAAQYMQAGRDTRPAVLIDQKYLERYGVILYRLGENEKARLYLQESLKYPQDAGTTHDAQKVLTEIDTKTVGGR